MVSDIQVDSATGRGDLPVQVTGSEISARVSRPLDIHASRHTSYSLYPLFLLTFAMPGSRLKKRISVDSHATPQPKTTRSPSSPDSKPRSPQEPYPMPSSNPASQYTLMEKLGTGSFGTVYKAMHNETRQIVAIKQIGAFLTPITLPAIDYVLTFVRRFPRAQTSKIQTTIFLKYNRKSLIWLSMNRNSSPVTMVPLLSITSSGSLWSTWLVVLVSTFSSRVYFLRHTLL